MHLIEEKVLATMQMKLLCKIEQRMLGKKHAVHDTIKGGTCLYTIVHLYVLAHERCLPNTPGSSDCNQLPSPLDGIHRITDDVGTYLINKRAVFLEKCFHFCSVFRHKYIKGY